MADGQRRFLRLGKLFLLTILPVGLLAVAAEACATMSISRRGETVVDSATGRGVYTMRIGRWPWSRVAVTPLNSLGYPDEEFPLADSESSCARVVMAGDSFVLGDGVDRDSNFVEIVRRSAPTLADGRCLRFYNLGVRGTTIDRQSEAISATLDRLQPHIVILTQYQNDLTDLTNPGAILDPDRERNRVRRTADSIRVQMAIFNANIIKMLTYQSFALMIRTGASRDLLSRWSVMANPDRAADARKYQETYSGLYGDLVRSLRGRGIAFGVIVIPSKLDVLAKRFPEEAFFLELANRHQVPALRLFPVLDARRRPYAFLTYDGHLNEHGNRLVAAEVSRWLFAQEPAPFPFLRQGTETPASPISKSQTPRRLSR